MNIPKVSVVIPVYNAQTYLTKTLNCILNQSLKDIEIICVNDGSKDNSLQILEEYATKDQRIKVFSQENSGVAVARNFAVQKAQGETIFFIDSDDLIYEKTLELMYNNIGDTDICVCQVQIFYQEADIIAPTNHNTKIYKMNNNFKKILKQILGLGCNKLYKKEIAKSTLYPVGIQPGEDDIYTFRITTKIKSYSLMAAKFYYYRLHPEQTMTSDPINLSHKMQKSAIALSQEIQAFLQNNKVASGLKTHLTRKASRLIYRSFINKTKGFPHEEIIKNINEINKLEKQGLFKPKKLRLNERIKLFFIKKKYNTKDQVNGF